GAFWPEVPICEYVPEVPVFRSILKPLSLFELSFHARLIVLEVPEAPASPDGAAGTVTPPQTLLGTLTVMVFELVEPLELVAWIRSVELRAGVMFSVWEKVSL